MKTKIMKLIKSRLALLGIIVLAVIGIMVVLGPFLISYNPTSQQYPVLQPPSFKHPMGTDDLGRDVLSRVLSGSRLSLAIGFLTVTLAFVVGLTAGSLSGYIGGFIDSLIMRLVDVFLAFPYVLGALALMVVLGSGFFNVVIAIAFFMWASFARLQRSSVLQLKEAEFVQAARLSGAGHSYILTRHIIPNSINPLVVYSATAVSSAIFAESVLSFIHIGLQPPTPSLGLMLNDALPFIESAPWLMIFPGLFLFLIVLSFILIADAFIEVLDPHAIKS